MTRTQILDQLSALADATRTRLLLVLEQYELTVGELCAALEMPQSTVSRHLKVLADDGWVDARGEGTSRFYRVSPTLGAAARDLWQVVRPEVAAEARAETDRRRAESAISRRRSNVRAFFSNAAGAWDQMRTDLIGARAELTSLFELFDDRWVVGDLGCGTGHVTEMLAPCVARVVAVDESGPMLEAAARRTATFDNVDLREGSIEALPIDDDALDVALLFLVTHFIAEPAQAFREAARVLRPGGRLVIVDLLTHDRTEYLTQLGHVWQGFTGEQVVQWLGNAGFTACRHRALPVDPTAAGPPLFVASARKMSSVPLPSSSFPHPS